MAKRKAQDPSIQRAAKKIRPQPVQDHASLDSTAEHLSFEANVRAAMKSTPRFLFRHWDEYSGGNADLNTVDAITPLAFLNDTAPQSFFDMPRSDIAQIATEHLYGLKCTTLFSSWSHSLPWVLRHARQNTSRISILDTKQLGPEHVILHTSAFRSVVDSSIGVYPHEFLAFGVITRRMYETVPLNTLIQHGLSRRYYSFGELIAQGVVPHHSTKQHADAVQSVLTTATRVGSLYSKGFAPAFAAHMLGLLLTNRALKINAAEHLSGMDLPAEWLGSDAGLGPKGNHHGFPEAHRAAELLQDIVNVKKTTPCRRITEVEKLGIEMNNWAR